ncbi:hypothetical protein WJ542_07825 [Paraburkholderia sp. B3]|uniref:hypothetical protein n=1 Tax=Paraburkholderia sp. B3 TaxID=3134791 RepID=UPI00398230A2
MPGYVKYAPDTLIKRYDTKVIGRGRDILERLITRAEMDGAWRTLGKHARHADHAWLLFREIVVIEDASRKPPTKLRSAERDDYLKIAGQAQELSLAIADGALDRRVYEFFSSEAMDINGIAGWENLDGMTRVTCAHSLLREWPPIIDILDALARQAENLASEAMLKSRVVERVSGQSDDFRKLYFVRELAKYIASEYAKSLHSTVADITNVVLDTSLIGVEISKIVKPPKKG